MQYFTILFWGWLVSFLGQLPLGTMSLTCTQIAVEENYKNAWKYAIGVAIIEMIVLRLVLSGVDWILKNNTLYILLGWLAVVLFLALCVLSIISALKHKPNQKTLLLRNNIDRFYLGITMSAMNPAQIPFWFLWSTYVIDMGGMSKSTFDYNLFTIGSGVGTITGLALYMYGGTAIINKIKDGSKKLNYIMAIVFLIAAIAQTFRMI